MPVVVPAQNALVLHLRAPERVAAVLPHKFIEFEGQRLVAVPHTVEAWRVLRNLGLPVAGFEPFRHRYRPPLIRGRDKPWPHQLDTAAFFTSETRGYCLNTPRTGKTASLLMAVDFLQQQRLIQSALVIAPNSTLHNVWAAEAFGMFPHWSVAVLTGDRAQRRALLTRAHRLFIINPDGIKVILDELAAAVAEKRIGAVAVDECTDYARRGTDRWSAAKKLIGSADYAWGLTGTPGDPEQVYGQARLLTPGTVPATFTTWRDHTMVKLRQFKWVPRAGHQAHVAQALRPAIRFDKKDLLDLPPVQFFDEDAPLSPEQTAAYERMRKDMLIRAQGIEVTAANAAVMASKLLQIATGAVRDDAGRAVHIPMPGRLESLERLIREAEFKIVIFAPFKAALQALRAHLGQRWSVELVDGDVTGRQRDAIFTAFQSQPDPHILLAHPKTVSFGIELAAADTIVFWGPPINGPFVYQQAIERINSVHQRSNAPAVFHLQSSPVERKLFASIRAGVDVNQGIVSLFNQIIQEPV